jgi:hypothetical protein
MKNEPITPQQIAAVMKPDRFNDAIKKQPTPKKLLGENKLTKDEAFWLRNFLFDGFYSCRPWDNPKRKAMVGIAKKMGFNELVEKFISDIIASLPIDINNYSERAEEIRKEYL